MLVIEHCLFTLFATFAEVLHLQDQIVKTLVNFLKINTTLLRHQLDDRCKKVLCQLYCIRAWKSHSFVIVTIHNCHEFAQVVSLKLPDNFKLSSWFLFSQVKVNLGKNSSHWRVKVVLNSIISPSRQKRRNLSPFVSHFVLHSEESLLLFLSPLISHNCGVELMLPSFPALFTTSEASSLNFEDLRNFYPLESVLRTFRHHLNDKVVFLSLNQMYLFGPSSFWRRIVCFLLESHQIIIIELIYFMDLI